MPSFSTNSIQDAIKCAFCQCNFTFSVKLIPDCGNSICGKCYEDLKENLLKSNEYECKVCHVWHFLPEGGLVDNLALLKIVQSAKRVLPEKAKELKSRISEARVRLDEMLNLYDLDAYCDRLKDSVKRSLEIKIEHLRGEADELIRTIDEYHDDAKLFKKGHRSRSAQFARKSIIPGEKFDSSLNDRIADIRTDFSEFSDEWNGYFTSSIQSLANQELESGLRDIGHLESRIKRLENDYKCHGFGNGHLRWRDNDLFIFKNHWLGKLDSTERADDLYETSGIKTIVCDNGYIDQVVQTTIDCDDGFINQVVFLPDSNMASCSSDNVIKIWRGCRQVSSTEIPEAVPTSMVGLTNGLLAIGFDDGSIQLRDLSTNELVRELIGHKKTVFSLSALSNGNLASVSYDNTIKIWNPNGCLLITIMDHNNRAEPIQLGILPNGNLVTCSNSYTGKRELSTIKIWNPQDGELVRSIQSSLFTPTASLVLSDGRIAIGSRTGTIRLVDFDQAEKSMTMSKSKQTAVLSIVQLPDGSLLSGSSAQSSSDRLVLFDLWDLKAGKHLKSIGSGHSDDVTSLSLHPNGKIVASSSKDGTIKLWSIKHLLSKSS